MIPDCDLKIMGQTYLKILLNVKVVEIGALRIGAIGRCLNNNPPPRSRYNNTMTTFSFRKINASKVLEYQACCSALHDEIQTLHYASLPPYDDFIASFGGPLPYTPCVSLGAFTSPLTTMEKMVMQPHKRKRSERTARKRASQAVLFGVKPPLVVQSDEDELGDEFDIESTEPFNFGGPDEPQGPPPAPRDEYGFPMMPLKEHYKALRHRFQQLKRPIETRYTAKSLVGKYYPLSKKNDDLAWRAEAVLVFNYMTWRARNTTERMIAVATFAKCMNTRLDRTLCVLTALRAAAEWYFPVGKKCKKKMQTQGLEETFTSLRGFLDKYDVIKTSPFFEKMYKFGSYALALSLFAPLGITMDHLKFDKVAQEAIKRKYHLGPDMIHSTLDTALFLTQRGYQCYQVGSIMPMFHSADKYQEWYDKAEVLQRQSNFLSNPEVHGIDRFKFLADLKDTIECGRSMKKCATKKDEKLIISKILGSLELTHDLEVTKRAAQRDRKTPLCLLLYGGSGIGKSTLQNILFHHYGETRGLSTLPEYRYVRNPTEAFWSGMNSTQWCVIMDDIAFLSPRLGMLDPSLAEMLCIANNVPFVPAQAELSDKGRTPVRAELVLGSTNTEHMNLHAYFSCPLAVQRRFPWVIDVAVKKEYQSDDKPGMLCSAKVPETPEGEYPDLWNFTIKRVEPCGTDRTNQMGKTVEDCSLTSMAAFIKWYNVVIDEHNTVQDKILAGNTRTYNTHACETCKMPANWCTCLPVQALEYDLFGELEMASPAYIYATEIQQRRNDVDRTLEAASYMARLWFYWYYAVFKCVHNTCLNRVANWWCGDYWFHKMVVGTPYKVEFAKMAMRYAGHRVNRRLGTTSAQLVGLAATIAGAVVAYKTYGWMVKDIMSPEPQGSVSSTPVEKVPSPLDAMGTKPTPDVDFVPRPSFEDKYPYNSMDLSQTSLCSKGTDGEVLKGNVRKATVSFKTVQESVARVTTAVNIRGSVFMCNYHGIPPTTPFILDVVADAHEKFSGSVSGILVTSSMVDYYPTKDLAFVQLRCLPPGTNLVPWIVKNTYTGKLNGMYIGRERTGEVWERAVRNVQEYAESWKAHSYGVNGNMWGGIVDQPTKVGDCGSLLITHSPAGWALLGIHTLGAGDEIRALRLDPDFVLLACTRLEPEIVSRGKIEVSAPSAPRNLGDLNVQSVARQVVGSGNIIGSFTGEFRQRGRTNVKETLLAPVLKVILGMEHTRAKPDMSRRPWLLALKDMVDPVVRLDNDTLKEAQVMFMTETRVQDYSQVFVYDLATAINGCPGLQYCDKMNRKSSAGAPYKKSKSHFMYFVDKMSTDMDVVDEIKDTIVTMIETYKKGERVHAVFCGHAKDEPVTFAKAAAGKTRIFTAAGMAHTLVTRMYLLSVIVFIQKRRFNFESGVGVAAQTLEWQEMYEYVTEYGTERMIAGDYAKFDKRMPANVILAAFDILIDICKRGGYSDDDLKVVRGIAYDTAFPTIDFHGDLIEFFGSNPSGHALTVIINDLANSLYMRYTFIALQPPGPKYRFKDVVKLLTYGDDNAMGVREGAPWFNHTAIQGVLGAAGIGYTMAEKEAVSVPYIPMSEVSFLKRVWRWEPAVRAHVAPLALDSMEKMLMVCVEKKNISPEHHAIQVVGTAVREYFFHGREVFEKMSAALHEAVWAAQLDLFVEDNTFPSWDQLVLDFEERSKHVKVVRDLSQ